MNGKDNIENIDIDDNMFDIGDEGIKSDDTDDNMIDFSELEDEIKKEAETKSEESTPEDEVTEEIKIEEPKSEDEGSEELSDDELELEKLLDELDVELNESNKSLDKIEDTPGIDNIEVSTLRDSLKKMEDQIKKINNNNADLKFRNAELESFNMEGADPKVMVIAKNFKRAKDGDDKARTKIVNSLKDMLYDFTGEDFDESKINKDIDILTASEMYNNEINPNLKKEKDDGFDGGIMV